MHELVHCKSSKVVPACVCTKPSQLAPVRCYVSARADVVSPSETPGRFKAFICLTASLDLKIIALVSLAFNLRQFEIDHVEICSAAAVIAARPS